MKRDRLIHFINTYLKVDTFRDHTFNGLQVIGKDEVRKIALGVSASKAFFEKSGSWGADLCITHHGHFWEEQDRTIDRIDKCRLQVLFTYNLNYAAYHLPLDAHPIVGNNVQIAKKIQLTHLQPFGEYDGKYIGYIGKLKKPLSLSTLQKKCDSIFHSRSSVLSFGPDQCRMVAVLSGGAGNRDIIDAIHRHADVLINGNLRETFFEYAREGNIHIINSGHYNTEKFGVQALGALLEKKFALKTSFIDIPNPL